MGVRLARRGTQWLAAVVLAALAFGCGGGSNGGGTVPPDEDTPATAVRTVTGFVGNATTGFGLSAVTVQIGNATTQTGTNGLFTLRDVPRADQTVTITATGYTPQTFTLGPSTDTINVRLVPTGVGGIEQPPGAPNL
ncbi:MAG: hypothetical protein IT204_06445 [Fimbriimonadaceae bacterium]|nr:hypothetical protein [Fimbriimonadaceae bacterium]